FNRVLRRTIAPCGRGSAGSDFCVALIPSRDHRKRSLRVQEQSSEFASALEHCLKAGVHFFFFNELASLSGCESLLNGGKEACFLVKIAGDDIRHQLLRIGARPGRDLRELRFLLGSEMDFHVPKIRENRLRGNAGAARWSRTLSTP